MHVFCCNLDTDFTAVKQRQCNEKWKRYKYNTKAKNENVSCGVVGVRDSDQNIDENESSGGQQINTDRNREILNNIHTHTSHKVHACV